MKKVQIEYSYNTESNTEFEAVHTFLIFSNTESSNFWYPAPTRLLKLGPSGSLSFSALKNGDGIVG